MGGLAAFSSIERAVCVKMALEEVVPLHGHTPFFKFQKHFVFKVLMK